MIPAKKERLLPFLMILIVLGAWTAAAKAQPSAAQQPAQATDWWMDMRIGPPLIDLFNDAARSDDIARVDHPNQIGQLQAIENGRKMIIFKSVEETEELLPDVAEEIDIIGYNLEHNPGTPAADQEDPLGSVQAMRALADEYGLQLALGPDHDFALSHGVELAPLVDIFVLQIQRQQTHPDVVAEFVEPIVPELRAANPDLEVSVQVRTEGDMREVVQMVEGLDVQLDGISILTSPETVGVAGELVQVLRPGTANFMQNLSGNTGTLLLLLAAAVVLVGAYYYWRRRQERPDS